MKMTTLLTTVIVLLSLTARFTGASAKPDADENCEWHYECCEYEADPDGGCKTLCPTPKIVCPAQDPSGAATEISPKAGKTRVIVTVPCKEGFMQDHQKMCRQVFSNL
ncbi:uncharacterized protein LOC118458782 [Anopheles albimanus]|uniref:uncharacterized protein LOC118458782 n=1 Tax=Anopheles albimanus TaxID=7167 RepID=UPI001640DD8F|nr:uncharacterized protein LOC118458782 [Anopheles albimanus]